MREHRSCVYARLMSSHDLSWFERIGMDAHDIRQSREIKRLDDDAEWAQERDELLAKSVQVVDARCDRLELVCEALLELVVTKEIVSKEELRVLMVQIDLRDGVEDGGLHPKRVDTNAPLCTRCERPVNPQREACVYCGAEVVHEPQVGVPKRKPKMVVCGGCQEEVDERETNFTGNGLRCDRCFASGN